MMLVNARFVSYLDAREFFSKAKTPSNGRPIKSGWRMYSEGLEKLFILAYGMRICTLHRDNTVTFDLSREDLPRIGNTISWVLPSVIPFAFSYVSKGRYVVSGTQVTVTVPEGLSWYSAFKKQAHEYFRHIKFDMATGMCHNPVPRVDQANADKDARLVWLRSSRKFMKGIKVRAKLGAFTSYTSSVDQHHRVMSQADVIQLLYECIRDEQYPDVLLRFLFSGSWRFSYYNRNADPNLVAVTRTKELLEEHSLELRRKFGVFPPLPEDSAA
jgi:hypothetical protein